MYIYNYIKGQSYPDPLPLSPESTGSGSGYDWPFQGVWVQKKPLFVSKKTFCVCGHFRLKNNLYLSQKKPLCAPCPSITQCKRQGS